MYSMMGSATRPVDLVNRAAEIGMKSVAITDSVTFGGVYDAYKAAKKKKIKLIVGCQYFFIDSVQLLEDEIIDGKKQKQDIHPRNFVLIAKNAEGYRNILKLNIESFKHKFNKLPLVDWEMLKERSKGVICLTGDAAGILSYKLSKCDFDGAEADAVKLREIFGDNLALELCPNNLRYSDVDQVMSNMGLKKLSLKLGIKSIAACSSRYLKKEHAKYLDLLMAVKNGRSLESRNRPRFELDQLYLHTGDEIALFFKRNFGEDFSKELCNNTLYFAKMCEEPEWISPDIVTGDKVQLPTFPVKDEECYEEFLDWMKKNPEITSLDEDKQYMRFLCEKAWFDRVPLGKYEKYRKRYETELDVYEKLGFSSYMLITADFLNWARKNNILCGYGRGSVGGSLVAYLLGIHQADPIKHGLIFERFLNTSKNEFPDVDNDVDSNSRDLVLQYVTCKYGVNSVAHVSNFITFTPKVAITDVMTCMEIGGSRQDAFKFAKNITETIPATVRNIQEAIEESKLFEEFAKERPDVVEYAEAILGLIRSWATHAAGVVIGKYDLYGLVPLRMDDNNVLALEWDKTRAEENGLVKIDFLGLETLNIIKTTEKIAKSLGKTITSAPDCYKYHSKVYDLITNGDTFGVFQLGASGGTIGLCNMTKPKSVEDLAVINALARPGVPVDVKKSYINRKFGREDIEIPHPNLERAIKSTMGYCIFEESFLWLAYDFCGWDLQKADKMRKISKLKAKGKHLLDELFEDYIESAMSHSKVSREFAEKIWNEWVIPLSGYAFNKSHSVLYSMTSFHTAYLKAFHYKEFMTANLISETNSNAPKAKENILKIRYALKKHGVEICPPDINESFPNYRLVSENKLLTGFAAMHGVKQPAADNILANRPFKSFEDFLVRTDSSKVRAPVVQALAACGALDSFKHTRKSMYLYCSDLRKKYKNWLKTKQTEEFSYKLPDDEWNSGELRALEAHFIGEALSGSKKESFEGLFSNHPSVTDIESIVEMKNKTPVVVEAEIKDMFFFKVKKKDSKIFGQECSRMLLEDLRGDQIGLVIFPEELDTLRYMFETHFDKAKLEKGFGARISGTVSRYNNEVSLIASDFYEICLPKEMPKDKIQKTIVISSVTSKNCRHKSSLDIENELLLCVDDSD